MFRSVMKLPSRRRPGRAGAIAAIFTLAVLTAAAASWQRGGNRLADREQRAIAEPFVGVTTGHGIVPDLFSVRATGISTEPVADAARSFLDSLSEAQRDRVLFRVDDPEWRRWANQHSLPRQGVSFEELDERQREAAFGLLRTGLSAEGFRKSRDIMRLNHTLGEISGRLDELGEWLYYLTVMGEPSREEPWGWQLDGHHLIVNYFVLGDQVVMTPTFMGSEPTAAESGAFAGVAVMKEEERRGLDLMLSLNGEQRLKARIGSTKDGRNALAEAFRDNLVLDYAGVPGSELDASQQELLVAVIQEFVGSMADGHARVKMEEVREHLDRTWFAWVGDVDPEGVFYYRVHSPVVLIEFDHQPPVFLPLPRVPTRQHVHSVIRTPNGNDYGKDLLRQHYLESHQSAGHDD